MNRGWLHSKKEIRRFKYLLYLVGRSIAVCVCIQKLIHWYLVKSLPRSPINLRKSILWFMSLLELVYGNLNLEFNELTHVVDCNHRESIFERISNLEKVL